MRIADVCSRLLLMVPCIVPQSACSTDLVEPGSPVAAARVTTPELWRRCVALGPPHPPAPPAGVCMPRHRRLEQIIKRHRPSCVPSGRWFEPASRPKSPGRPGVPPSRAPTPRIDVQPRLAGCIDGELFRRKFRDQQPELRCCLLASPPDQPPVLLRIRFTVPCHGLVQEVALAADPYLADPALPNPSDRDLAIPSGAPGR